MGGILSSIVPVLIMIFVFRTVIISMNRKVDSEVKRKPVKTVPTDYVPNTESVKPQTNRPRSTGVSEGMRGGTSGSAGARKKGEMSVRYTMEDRQHDWLAKQLAEERIAKKKMSEMFSLKQEHLNDCDARQNRNLHNRHCDAQGVDTATIL